MTWYTYDEKHYKTTRRVLGNLRFVTQRKSMRIVNFYKKAYDNGIFLRFVPTRTSRLNMKKKRGIISKVWLLIGMGGITHV